jgi:hypothetical protein
MQKALLALGVVVALSGCGSAYRSQQIFSTDSDLTTIDTVACNKHMCGWNPVTWIEQIAFKTPVLQINPYLFKTADSGESLYQQAIKVETGCSASGPGKPVTLANAERARNELIGTALQLADASISEHLSDIKSTETNMNLLFGGATAALTGGASVAGAEGAKVLSAAATGTNAGRSIFNESTYRNALGETLTGSIETDRVLKRTEIINRLTTECTASYPVSVALADVQNYLNGGSFYHGLALIREAAEKANAKRRGEITLDDPLAKQMYDNQLKELQGQAKAIELKNAQTEAELAKLKPAPAANP